MTALLEYLDLLQCLKITVLGHVHLSTCNINNSPHKLEFQFSMRAGDQKLRFDLVWPYYMPHVARESQRWRYKPRNVRHSDSGIGSGKAVEGAKQIWIKVDYTC